jgi:hypothetical protein
MIASAGKHVEPGGSETYILQELKAMTYTENTLENIKGLPFDRIELIFLELWEVMALKKLINGLEISPELRNVGCRDNLPHVIVLHTQSSIMLMTSKCRRHIAIEGPSAG